MSGWRAGAIVREALANLASTTARLIVLATVVGGMSATVVWLELAAVGDALALEQRFVDGGGYVAVVASESGLDAAVCDRLRHHREVLGSGGFAAAGTVTSTTSPRVAFQHTHITSGLVTVWDADARLTPGSYIVGQAAADELGLLPGSWLDLEDVGRATVDVIDPGARNDFASRAIMDVVPAAGTLAECWVEFRPSSFTAGLAVLPAMFAADEPQVRRALDRGELADDPGARIVSRATRFGWVPAAIVAAAVIGLTSIVRRPETAVYRAFGLSRLGVLMMFQVETAVLAGACGLLGAAWAIATHSVLVGLPTFEQAAIALRSCLLFMMALAAAGPLVAASAASGSPASLLKER